MTAQDELTLDELGDEITTLAAHMNAAMCRWLGLVAEFDEREGWGAWGCRSCAEWISWRCSIAPGPAREHVRVARRLADLPLVRRAFAGGELSYSKARALTRVEDVEREQELLELARSCTAAQLEQIVRRYRGVLRAEAAQAYDQRFLTVAHDDDGSVVIRGRLPREDGALLVKALEAAGDRLADDRRRSANGDDVPAGTSDAGARNADALVLLADTALSPTAGIARSGGDRYQVVVHVDADALRDDGAAQRCHLEDGAPVAIETVRRLSCDAGLVSLVERAGRPLSVGRKTRSIPPALRRALRSRDGGCRFPGCLQRRGVDAHHIEHWARGGPTALGNLVELCHHHHRLVHEGGYRVERRAGALAFRRPDGRLIRPVAPARLGDQRSLVGDNRRLGLRVTPETGVPRWYGERVDMAAAVGAMLTFAPLRL